jgi:hypothetical protein
MKACRLERAMGRLVASHLAKSNWPLNTTLLLYHMYSLLSC